jgi:hypothetical protein
MNPSRKFVFLAFLTLILAALSFPALAADTASSGAASPSIDWPQLLIPLITPILIMVAKVVAPKLPKTLLPILAPILGAGLDILMHFAGLGSGGPLLGAILGAAGVGVREILDQLRKQQATPA